MTICSTQSARSSISCCALAFLLLLALPRIWAQPCQQFPAQVAAAPDDTSKVILLDNFVKCLNDVNLDSALAVNRRAIALAERLNFKRGLVLSLVRVKGPLLSKGMYDELKARLERGERLCRETRDTFWLCRYQYTWSDYHLVKGEFDRASEVANAALIVAERQKDAKLIPTLVAQIASAHFGAGRYEKALETHLKSLELAEKAKRPTAELAALVSLSITYSYLQKDWDAFLAYNSRGIALAKSLNNTQQLTILYNNLGAYYARRVPQDPRTQQTYEDAYQAATSSGYDLEKAYIALALAKIHMTAGDMGKAAEYAQTGGQLAEKIKDISLLTEASIFQGDVECNLENYASAIQFYEKALELHHQGTVLQVQYTILTKLAKACADNGDYQKAYDYGEHARVLNDSLFTQESALKTSKLESQYRLERKDGELKLLAQEKNLQALRLQSQTTELERRRLLALTMENNQRLLASENELQAFSLREKTDSIGRQKLLFEVEQTKSAAQIAQAEAERQATLRRMYTAVAILAALLIGLGVAFYLFRSRQRLRRQVAALERASALENLRLDIAQDIHDEVGAELTKISLSARFAAMLPQLSDAELRQKLSTISAESRSVAHHLGDIVFAITPRYDHFSEVQAYFREKGREFLEEARLNVQFDFPPQAENPTVSPDVKRQLYMIYRESLNNIAKHAQASTVQVALRLSEDAQRYVLEIRDDGIGFDPANTRQFGNGLAAMRDRAEKIGAVLSIETAPERGTAVRVEGKV